MLEYRGRCVLAAEHRLGQRKQVLGLLRAARGLPGAKGCQVHDAAHGHRDGDEQQQGQQALPVGNGQRVHGRGEVPVHQQAGSDGREHGRPEAAHDRDGDDGYQVDEQIVTEVQVQGGQQHRQQRQAAGQQYASQNPAAADAAAQVGEAAPAAVLPAQPGPVRRPGLIQCRDLARVSTLTGVSALVRRPA